MKTLIVYATRHGCTEECASVLKDRLSGEIRVLNLKNNVRIDLSAYETVIIGGSIHAGQIQKKVKKFYQNNVEVLMKKKLGLFLCCMEEREKANEQFREAFPERLRDHASATGIFGGEFRFERMNFIERYMVKKIAHIDENVSNISEESINSFIHQLDAT